MQLQEVVISEEPVDQGVVQEVMDLIQLLLVLVLLIKVMLVVQVMQVVLPLEAAVEEQVQLEAVFQVMDKQVVLEVQE